MALALNWSKIQRYDLKYFMILLYLFNGANQDVKIHSKFLIVYKNSPQFIRTSITAKKIQYIQSLVCLLEASFAQIEYSKLCSLSMCFAEIVTPTKNKKMIRKFVALFEYNRSDSFLNEPNPCLFLFIFVFSTGLNSNLN